jgi:hypothetical protein
MTHNHMRAMSKSKSKNADHLLLRQLAVLLVSCNMFIYLSWRSHPFLDGTGSFISDLQSLGVSYADARVSPATVVFAT